MPSSSMLDCGCILTPSCSNCDLIQARTFESGLRQVAGDARLVPELSNESDREHLHACRREAESVVSQLKPLVGADGPIDLVSLKRELQVRERAQITHKKFAVSIEKDSDLWLAGDKEGMHRRHIRAARRAR
jgi:hypothetical protein